MKRKVLAYITSGARLLIFRHTHFPQAGIQVPAGTVKPGEPPHLAVLREAEEETGLKNLIVKRFLGEQLLDMTEFGLSEIHQRRFYHLLASDELPETWRHYELDPSDGSPAPIEFEFFWAQLPDGIPELSGNQGALIPELLRGLDRPKL